MVEAVEAGRQYFDPDIWGFDHMGTGRTLLVNPLERVAAWTDEQLAPTRWAPLPESLDVDPDMRPSERPRWAFDAELARVAVFDVDEMSIHDCSFATQPQRPSSIGS